MLLERTNVAHSDPAALPVTVAECKAYARINFDDDDAVIESLIEAARDHLEQATGRVLVSTRFRLTLDEFACNEIMLPRSPVISVDAVTYADSNGDEQTLAAEDAFTTDLRSEPAWIVPAANTRWPATFRGINAVAIDFTAGHASVGSPPDYSALIPARAKLSIKALVAHWFAEREPIPDTARVTEIPYHLTRLVNGLRVWR